ncbi:hypothetical protein Vi05172_g3208 [Venturia inaequalis]|nr:hypothetical protein Vi05172_g3208 [Venturia inaequalis]
MRERNQMKNWGMLAHLRVRFFADAGSLDREEPALRWLWQVFQEVSRHDSAHRVDREHLGPTLRALCSYEFHSGQEVESDLAFAQYVDGPGA